MAHTPFPPVRVLVADDHAPTRLTVGEELREAGFSVCAQAATASEAVEAAVREKPDICLLDISMPGDGLSAAAEICERVPSAKVVMLTSADSEEALLWAVRAGASGYLLKDDDPARLPIALQDVLAGIPAFPRRLSRSLVAAARLALVPPASA